MGAAIDKATARGRPDKVRRSKPVADKTRGRVGSAAKLKTVKGRPAQGATRKAAQSERPPGNFAWLNRILILLGGGVVVIAALQAYITLQKIPVQQITVTGEMEHIRNQAVQDMVQPALAGGFLKADLQRVRQQLEALPWIYRASVRRVWPNALEIHVVEQLPIARWGGDGFLNHEGEVFRPSHGQDWKSLPLLQGPQGAARDLMSIYQRMVNILGPLDLALVQLAVDERGQVEAVLETGIRLVVGGDDFLERMQRFVSIYPSELAVRAGEIERVDLRYESGMAVAFTEPPAVADSY
jgi:cell division protein FtsQ